MIVRKISLVAVLLLINFSIYAQHQIFVAQNGDDQHDGTINHPFKSIKKAINYLKSSEANDIKIIFREGEYDLSHPIVVDSLLMHSLQRLTFMAYADEKVVISGGINAHEWKAFDGDIYYTELPEDTKPFRSLYMNETKLVRARHPNTCNYYNYNWNDSLARLESKNLDLPAGYSNSFDNPTEVFLQRIWSTDIFRLSSIYDVGKYSVMKLFPDNDPVFKERNHTKLPDQAFHLENNFAFVDDENEWYFDQEDKRLYLKFPHGLDSLNRAHVKIPQLEQLLVISGSSSELVRNVTLQGITFAYINGTISSTVGFYVTQANIPVRKKNPLHAAIEVENARNLRIKDNSFMNLGGGAILFETNVKRSAIEGNVFKNVEKNAVAVDWNWKVEDRAHHCSFINISNNLLTTIGYDYPGAVGIFVGLGDSIIIENNHLFDLAYSGISVGMGHSYNISNAKNNIIRSNYISYALTLLTDGAAIYTLSNQPGTKIYGNFMENILKSPWSAPFYASSGIYLDQGSSNINLYGNNFENVYIHYTFNTTAITNFIDLPSDQEPAAVKPLGGAHTVASGNNSSSKYGLSFKYRPLLKGNLASNICYGSWFNESNLVNIKLYPNPASQQLTLSNYHLTWSDYVNYQILDTSGSVIKSGGAPNYFSDKFLLDVNDLHDGIYLLYLTFGKYMSVKKFVIRQ